MRVKTNWRKSNTKPAGKSRKNLLKKMSSMRFEKKKQYEEQKSEMNNVKKCTSRKKIELYEHCSETKNSESCDEKLTNATSIDTNKVFFLFGTSMKN